MPETSASRRATSRRLTLPAVGRGPQQRRVRYKKLLSTERRRRRDQPQLAVARADLGGMMEVRRLSPKERWFDRRFGWSIWAI
jgi:hypothetical protein